MIPERDISEIIYRNPLNIRHWFSSDGKYIEEFDGMDGEHYAMFVEQEYWTPSMWDLFKKEGMLNKKP